jgi:hypothetical protein
METTRLLARREVAADPASIALLLASPEAAGLWPGVVDVASAGGSATLAADVPGRGRISVTLSTTAPLRLPTCFVMNFAVVSAELPSLAGELVIERLPAVTGQPCSQVELRLAYSGDEAARLQELAEGFLANLRVAAESRARAA